LLAVRQIRHANHSVKWQRPVRRREIVHLVYFAVRRAAPLKWIAIPRSNSFFDPSAGDTGLLNRRRCA
jgi:hypothetical protein